MLLGLATVGAGPGDSTPLNTRSLQIPIRINPERQGDIAELLLFVSNDQGQSWQRYAVADPSQDAFSFTAVSDGTYWFSVQVVDRQGRREPTDINAVPPGQKVTIDTTPPALRLRSVERVGDEVSVTWEVNETNPDLNTLKLEYRANDAPPTVGWYPVSLSQAALAGQTKFRVPVGVAVTVRMTMSDIAGNTGAEQKDVTNGGMPNAVTSTTIPTPSAPLPLQPVRREELVPSPPAISFSPTPTSIPSPQLTSQGGSFSIPVEPISTPQSMTQPPPGATTPQYAADSSVRPESTKVAESSPPALQPAAATTGPKDAIGWGGASTPVQPSQSNHAPIAQPQFVGGGLLPQPPAAALPQRPSNAQMVNNTRLQLAYEVEKSGPSGVKLLELWLTRDEGRTWEKFLEHTQLDAPLTVDLPGEGLFGLTIVAYSGAGFTTGPPQPGDTPEMRVEVDMRPPEVVLTGIYPDPGRADSVILTWKAEDKNLTSTPITLEWSDNADSASWTPVTPNGAAIGNSGTYTWNLPSRVPYRVYLRVRARDTAGNIGEYKTTQSVPIDLKKPEVKLKSIVPISTPATSTSSYQRYR
jgi:hypothetical protein